MRRQSSGMHERFLRYIWTNQYLSHARLKTLDGRPVQIVQPGRLSTDSGPDVRGARLIIGEKRFSGDVEIHRSMENWLQHRHQEDPRYNKVILHVVLTRPQKPVPVESHSGRSIPTLILEDCLDAPIRTVWRRAMEDERLDRLEHIPCRERNANVPPVVIRDWLTSLSHQRIELKLRRFRERLMELALERRMIVSEPSSPGEDEPDLPDPPEDPPPPSGPTPYDLSRKEIWEQLLFEGLCEALGYSRNRDPFVRLARSVTLHRIRELVPDASPGKVHALLAGASGLAPDSSLPFWRSVRERFGGEVLQKADWVLAPTRPENSPPVRMATAAEIAASILHDDLFRRVIAVLKDDLKTAARITSLHRLLSFPSGVSRKDSRATPGPSRRVEMIVNIVIPVALLYARMYRDHAVRESVRTMFSSLPSESPNAVIRLMARDLLKRRVPCDTAQIAQGLLQCYLFYCRQKRCDECSIGRWAESHDEGTRTT